MQLTMGKVLATRACFVLTTRSISHPKFTPDKANELGVTLEVALVLINDTNGYKAGLIL